MAKCTIFKNFIEPIEDKALLLIIKDIKSDKYKKNINKIRSLVSNNMTKEIKDNIDNLKKKLPAFTPSGSFSNGRTTNSIVLYSGFVHLDFDDIALEMIPSIKQKLETSPHTFAYFLSPKGKGLKVFVEVDSGKENHDLAYTSVQQYYENLTGLKSDPKCKDISRLCFFSYDPDAYININHQKFKVTINAFNNTPTKNNNHTIIHTNESQVLGYTSNIELNFQFLKLIEFTNLKETYHEGNRNNYIYLLASNCNRSGISQSDTENLCIQNFDLSENEIKKTVNSAFMHHVSEKNKYPLNSLIPQILKSSEEDNLMPTLPNEIFDTIPYFLKNVTEVTSSNEERDTLFLTSIVMLSGVIPSVVGKYADTTVNANLFLFVVAKASAGKGSMVHCKKLVEKIHTELKKESLKQKEQYDAALDEYIANKKNNKKIQKPDKPNQKMLFIPANNSSTGFFELLANNNGKGIIFETEGDTLSKSFKSEYGDFSDGFRNAFHHETISYYRRTDKEFIEIKRPQLTAILSGTPKQVPVLIPSAENGLFSRFIFYSMNMQVIWKDVFASKTEKGLDKFFESLGNDFYTLYKSINMHQEIIFSLTETQQVEFNKFFTKVQQYYSGVQEEDIISSIRRLGLIAFRIMMVFSTLRIMEHGEDSNTLICEDIDFQNTLKIIDVLVKHSSHIFTQIGVNQPLSKKDNKKEKLYQNLPANFNKKISDKIAISVGITIKTSESYIRELVHAGLILHPSKDNYINPSKLNQNNNETSK